MPMDQDTHEQLRPHSAAVLDYLRANSGSVVSKQRLMDAVWPDVHVTENSLYQCVTEIRRHLKSVPGQELRTVPRKGYVLVKTPAADTARKPSPRWTLATLTVFGLGLGGWLLGSAPTQPDRLGVQVGAFTSIGDDLTFGESLGREVALSLAANKWLHVYVDDSPEARFSLDGHVMAQAGTVHVTARLVERQTGQLVWSRSWNGPESGFLNLQGTVAKDAAAELGGHWSGAVVRFDGVKAAAATSASPDAYALYLRAVQAKHRFTVEGLEEARMLLTKAVSMDPGFVDAWTTLSVVHNLRALTVRDRVALERILTERTAAVVHAQRLAPEDPQVLMETGWLMARRNDHRAARASILRAVEMAPDNPDVLAYAALNGNLRVNLGAEGTVWMAKARQLNPDPPAWYAIGEGLAQFSKRDFAASLAAFDKAPDYVTRYLCSAVALEQLGRISEARTMADHLNAKYPGFRPSYYVYQEAMDMGANGALLIESAARLGIPAVVSPPANVAASSDRKP